MKNAIEIRSLVKKYKDGFKLGPMDIEIPSGIIVGMIGENGAGKTTFIKSILKIIKKDQGSIKIFDKDIDQEEVKIKENIGVVLDDMFFPEILNANDINSPTKDIYTSWDEDLFYNYLKEFDLPRNKTIKSLSKGMRKKLEIITALSHKPMLLILDEPTRNVSPLSNPVIRKVLKEFKGTIISVSHDRKYIEEVIDKLYTLTPNGLILEKS